MTVPRFLPLTLPAGWGIMFNALYDLTITPENRLWFDEDLLWLTRVHLTATGVQQQPGDIDVGWYPSAALDGTYRVRLLGRDGWESILIDFASRDRIAVAQAIALCSEAPLDSPTNARAFFAEHWQGRYGDLPAS